MRCIIFSQFQAGIELLDHAVKSDPKVLIKSRNKNLKKIFIL
jgi:hypothetical protein